MKIRPVEPSCSMREDGWTDLAKVIVAFRNIRPRLKRTLAVEIASACTSVCPSIPSPTLPTFDIYSDFMGLSLICRGTSILKRVEQTLCSFDWSQTTCSAYKPVFFFKFNYVTTKLRTVLNNLHRSSTWVFVGKRCGRTDFRVKNAYKFASVFWGVMRAKRQVRSVTCRACRLQPGCETQYIALTVRVIQELTCCCTMSRNDSVFLHLIALTFHLIAHYLTIQARQGRAGCTHACSFIAGHICSKHVWSSH
jgi:hypothetical protein